MYRSLREWPYELITGTSRDPETERRGTNREVRILARNRRAVRLMIATHRCA